MLVAVILMALKPSYQLAKSNDIQRRADVNSIVNAVWQYTIDNSGNLPADLNIAGAMTATNICMGSGSTACSGLIDLQVLVPDYINTIPGDPRFAVYPDSEYSISKNTGGFLQISAPQCELDGCNITITR